MAKSVNNLVKVG